MKALGDRQDIQDALRKDNSRIPIFVEESLRMDAPVKSRFRLAKKGITSATPTFPRVPR